MPAPAITLLTDFGTVDGYVAEMKGVLLSHSPGVPVLDMTHDLPPQDIEFARLTLARYWRRFPPGTVHLVVVDPTVGSSRAAIAVESNGRFLVGPDNGVLSPALFDRTARVFELPVAGAASRTFHGRDIFAPAASALANDVLLESLGTEFHTAEVHRTPAVVRAADGSIRGQVITVDRFGNAVTNIFASNAESLVVDCAGGARTLRIVGCYADADFSEPVALMGSLGFLEIAVRNESAARFLSLERGMPVTAILAR